jgi:hypothetical protein
MDYAAASSGGLRVTDLVFGVIADSAMRATITDRDVHDHGYTSARRGGSGAQPMGAGKVMEAPVRGQTHAAAGSLA